MQIPTSPSAERDRADLSSKSSVGFPIYGGLESALHLGIALFLIVSFRRLLGPRPKSRMEFQSRMLLVGLVLRSRSWPGSRGSRRSMAVKIASILGCVLLPLYTGFRSSREFNASIRLLEPVRIIQGRIVHEAIGLSYAKVREYQLIVRPAACATLGNGQGINVAIPVAAVNHHADSNAQPEETQSPEAVPATVTVLVRRQDVAGYDAFVNSVTELEKARAPATPGVRIAQATHHSQIAGIDMLEFESVQKKPYMVTRHIFLKLDEFEACFEDCAQGMNRIGLSLMNSCEFGVGLITNSTSDRRNSHKESIAISSYSRGFRSFALPRAATTA